MLSKTFSTIARSQKSGSSIAKILANGASSTFGQSISGIDSQGTEQAPSYLQSNRQFSTVSVDFGASQFQGGVSGISQSLGSIRQFSSSQNGEGGEVSIEQSKELEKKPEDVVLDAFIDVKKKSEPEMGPYLEQFADIIKDSKNKDELTIKAANLFNGAGNERGEGFKSKLMYTAFQADAVSALMKDTSVKNDDFAYKAADAYIEVVNKTDPELSPFMERFKEIRNIGDDKESRDSYEKLFSNVMEKGGDVSKRFWDVIDDAEALAFNLATRESSLSQVVTPDYNLPKTYAEKVGDSVFDAFLNVAKEKEPELVPYIDQVQKIEQGTDEVQKADEYSKLWEKVGEEGGKSLQTKFAETISKAKDLSDRSQLSTEADLFESELEKLGSLSSPQSVASNEILSSVSLGDIKNITDTRERMRYKPVDSKYRELAENIAQRRIRSESGGNAYLLHSDMEELYDTPISRKSSSEGNLNAVPSVAQTVEQISHKLGILSNFHPSSNTDEKVEQGESAATDSKKMSEKEMILSVIDQIEQDENPTTRKIKEALPELSGDLAEKLRDEVLAEGKPTDPEKKQQQHKRISNVIDTVRTINEEAANIGELETLYSGMAEVVQKGKSSAAETMFDDSVELPFEELPQINERIAQIHSQPSSKPSSSASKKGIQAFADKFLSERYSEMIETKDIPLDKDYWDTMKAMDLMSEEYKYKSIVPENLRQAQEGKDMPKGLEELTRQQKQDKDLQNQR